MKVSTIIPVYNGERTIVQAIDSALSQQCNDHEVIVVNDGSTDSTAKILQGYKNQIHLISLPNGGQAKARNVGVAESDGRYLAFLDADDVWVPTKLQTMVSIIENNPSASLAFSECRFIDQHGVECGESSLGRAPSMDEMLTHHTAILPSTWVLRRDVFDRVGGFCERFNGSQGYEDTWTLLLLREQGPFIYVPEGLTLYRLNDQISADKYGPGLPILISLARARYGRRASRLIRTTKKDQCRPLLSKAAHQMNRGDKLGAFRTLTLIFRLWPTYFLRREFLRRLLAPQNARRFRQMISILPSSHSR
jgi:glycosyltransferase involved in cell wall biosynthesis